MSDEIKAVDLVNPDSANFNEDKYVWDIEIQQQILSLLLRDKFFLLQALNLIKPSYFVESIHSKICKILYSYFNQYKTLPSRQYVEMLVKEDIKDDNPILPYYVGEIKATFEAYVPGMDHRDFLLDKITEFAKVQSAKEATAQMLSLLNKNNPNKWSIIRDIWQTALQVDRNVDIGSDYFNTIEERYVRLLSEADNKEKFITGFKSIDDALDGGLSRGEIGSFAGASGSGKSVCLIQSAARNLARGKKILYVSLEMSEDKIAARFDSMLTGIPLSKLKNEQENVISTLNGKFFPTSPDRNRLQIKQFSASTADTTTLRAYMSELALYGFTPDLVVVDYVGEFRDYPGIKTYESRERHVRELRAFAIEYNVCVFTAMQLNRSAREAMDMDGVADDSNLADSAGQVRPLDALWIINQNEHQKKAHVGKIYVAKHRNGKSRFTLYYRQFEETLKMVEIDAQKFKIAISAVENKIKDEVQIDDLSSGSGFAPNRG